MTNPTDNQTPQPVDNGQELLELLMTIRTTREVEHNDNQWTTEFVYSIEQAKARLLQWGTEQYKKGYIDGGIAEITK